MNSVTVSIARIAGAEDLPLPSYQTEHSAGMDLHAAVTADVVVPAGQIAVIPLGFRLAVPDGYAAELRPRSGLAAREGISIPNSPATIDSDYRGEVRVPLINHGHQDFTVRRGMRIAQMLVMPVPRVTWQERSALPETARGAGGFGHTGTD
ncbi:MAG: dUTP diphosphatase [Planctomycetota bacterium]